MKKLLFLILILPLLQACPYESNIPIESKEKAPVLPVLEGIWESGSSAKPSQTVITSLNPHEYLVKHYRQVNNKIAIYKFQGFLTKVDDLYFVNLYEPELNFTKGGYLIFKLTILGPEMIKLSEVNRYSLKTQFATSQELKDYLIKNKNNGTLFNTSEVWNKKTPD